MGFTYSKVILFSVIIFAGIFSISLILAQTILARWFDPRYEQVQLNKQLIELDLKVDSLYQEVDRKDQFIMSIQRVLRGDTAEFNDPAKVLSGENQPINRTVNYALNPADSAFRKEFENSDLALITLPNMKYRELQETFFFSPLSGFISDHFNAQNGHFGVDLVAKTNEPVKNIADGTVIFSSWTQDSGYVIMIQHKGNLISVYKHNAQLYKKVGTFVNGGEIISIVGNSGEMTDGPHLHFELWYNGNPLNPEEFVTF
jgi:murein DD-endopeptidase MepM/ murein hydrolase activator NlpD